MRDTDFAMNKASALVLLASLACTGCTVQEVVTAEKTELEVASLNVSEHLLLDVGIVNFDPGMPKNNDPDETGVYAEIREAESRYLPYHLKTTLQSTGYWGAVRVVPSNEVYSDVLVSGAIEQSDGEYVTLTLTARDATGREWFERTYAAQTGARSYAETRDRTEDPYQKVFNDFANDLRAHAAAMDPRDVARIRETSELLFFSDMAPLAFGEHVAVDDDGMVNLVRLPAENDPMVIQLRQIRERDRLVVDMLNDVLPGGSNGRVWLSGGVLAGFDRRHPGRELGRDRTFITTPLLGGLDPALAWRGLRLFEREVWPHVRDLQG